MGNWYRVVDPLSPLFGCDVKVGQMISVSSSARLWVPVLSLRRVDVFVGDRPFQLVGNADGLGLMIDASYLDEAAIQDEIMVTATDRPFGLCLDESELTRPDGYTLLVARYERGTQLALQCPDGSLSATKTYAGESGVHVAESMIEIFMAEDDPDDITATLKRRD